MTDRERQERIERGWATLRRESGLRMEGRLGPLVRRRLGGLMTDAAADGPSLPMLIEALSAPAQPLFAQVELWRAFRTAVLPRLRTYPSISIWIAGCGQGDEALALAILLAEQGLAGRARIYATDVCEATVTEASRAFVGTNALAAAIPRHAETGAPGSLAEHFRPHRGGYQLAPSLRERLVFGIHNPATDGALNEFQLVIYRHLLGALEPEQERHAFRVLEGSVCRLGILLPAEGDEPPAELTSSFTPSGMNGRMLRRVR